MSTNHQLVAQLSTSAQMVIINSGVLNYLSNFKQDKFHKLEAGGQLFCLVHELGIEITLATGPYKGDTRTRSSYRSEPSRAQLEILKRRKQGLYYCGDWHTHPERFPSASEEDLDTISVLVQRSELRLNTLVMLIQGTSDGPEGIAVYSCDGGIPVKWSVNEKC